MKLYIKMQASFFADCCICHLPKWHLIPFNYQRMYSRYKIWSFFFAFTARGGRGTLRKLGEEFCSWSSFVILGLEVNQKRIQLFFLSENSRSITIRWDCNPEHLTVRHLPVPLLLGRNCPLPCECFLTAEVYFHGQYGLIVLRSKPTGKPLVVAMYHAVVLGKVLNDT